MGVFLKDGLIAVTWMVMGIAVGFELGGAFARLVRSSARSRRMNDDASEPAPGDAPARTPGAEPSPSFHAKHDYGRENGAGNGDVGINGHAAILPQKQEAGKFTNAVPATCADVAAGLLNLLKVGLAEDANNGLIKADGSLDDNACLLIAISYSFVKFVSEYAPSQAAKSLSDAKIALVTVIGQLLHDNQEAE